MSEIHTLVTNSECRPHPGEYYPSSASYCHPFGAITNYSSGQFIILSGQLPQGDGKHGKTSESMNMSPLPHFICYKMSSLLRSNAGWNTQMVNEAFCKSTVVVFAKTFQAGKANVSRASIPVRTKFCPCYDGSKWSNVICLTLGKQLEDLDHVGNVAIWGFSVDPLMLARQTLVSAFSHIGPEKQTFVFLSLSVASILAPMGALFIILLGKNKHEWGRYMIGTQTGYCV